MGGLFETEKGKGHFTDLRWSAYVFDPKNKIILNRKESEALNILKNNANKYNTLDISVLNDVQLKINTNNPVELVNYYNTLEKALVELGTKGLKDTATGKSIEEELNQLQSSYDDIMNAFEGILLELYAKENEIEMQQKKILVNIITNMKKTISDGIKKGEISPDTDIEEAVKTYVASLNILM